MIADNGRNDDDFDDDFDEDFDDDALDEDDDLLDDDDDDDDEEADEDEMPDIGGDTLIDISGELRVDELVAKSSETDPDEAAHRREVRRRLEELDERRKSELDDTFNFNLDDES